MTGLKITLLGHPSVLWDDQPLAISRKATRTLLYYLASQGKPVGRTLLCSLFWPEATEQEARSNLRSLLSKLRESLPDPDLIISQEGLVSIDFSRVYIDQVIFENLYKGLRNRPWHYPDDVSLPLPIADSILAGLRCWSGDHFLEDAELVSTPGLDEWLLFTDLNLVTFRKRFIQRIANHYKAIGEVGIANRWLITLLGYDRLNPDLNYEILSHLIQSGRIQDAKSRLSILQKYFKKTTGQELPEKIKALGKQLEQAGNYLEVKKAPPWPYPSGMNTYLVGRRDELDILQNAYQRGGVAVIRGEGGSGKTRLMQELHKQIWQDTRLLVLKCTEHDPPIMMDAIIDLLNNQVTDAEWKLLPNVWVNILSLLVPSLTSKRANVIVPEHLYGTQGQRLIFEALLYLLQIYTREHRVLLVLDDAQWADDATLAAIQLLHSKEFFKNNGLLLIAYQPQQDNNSIQKLIKGFSRSSPVIELELTPLNGEEVKLLVDQIMPQFPSSEFVEHLTEVTGGNPFFIIETARAIMDESIEDLKNIENLAIPVPKNIYELTKLRLSRLPSDTVECLNAAAVFGAKDFSVNLLANILEKPEAIVSQHFKTITKIGYFRKSETIGLNPTNYHFSHDYVKKIVLELITVEDQQIFHQKIARVLERKVIDGSNISASEIASHYEAGEMFSEAIQFWLDAAKQTWRTYNREETQKIFDHIHDILEKKSEVSNELIVEVYFQQGQFAFECSDPDQSTVLGNTCLEKGKQFNLTQLIGIALYLLGNAALQKGEKNEALNHYESSMTYLAVTDLKQYQRQVSLQKGLVLTLLQRYQEAMQAYRFVFENEIEVNDIEQMRLIFTAHFHLSMLLYRTGNTEASYEEIQKNYEKYQYILSPYNQIQADLVFAYNFGSMGNYIEGYKHALAGLEISRAMQNQYIGEFMLYLTAYFEIRLGYLDQGITHAYELIESAKKSLPSEMSMRGYGLLGYAHLVLDDYERAIEILDKSTVEALPSQIYYENLSNKASALTQMGLIDQSEALIQSILSKTRVSGLQGPTTRATLVHMMNKIIQGNYDQVEQTLLNLETEAKADGRLMHQQRCLHTLLIYYLRIGQFDKTETLFNQVIEWGRQSHSPWLLIKAPLEWAKIPTIDEDVRARWISEAKSLMNIISENAQCGEIRGAFERARKKWFVN